MRRTAKDGWRCNPVGWWMLEDIWAFIASHELPYSSVYDRLAEIGVPRHLQRVGPIGRGEGNQDSQELPAGGAT
ncbi:MAG: hypothetical protein ACREQE_05735, partial [Candidatus Binataceae bacterium]